MRQAWLRSIAASKGARMKGLFLDATDGLAAVFRKVVRPDDPPVAVNLQSEVKQAQIPGLLAGHDFILDDHTALPAETMRAVLRAEARRVPGHRRA